MPDTHVLAERPAQDGIATYDAIVIGAGISGMFMLYRLRELGMTARVYEAGTNVGGTWYWNLYPGARFDSESWTYGYSFSKELMQEWDWKEHFSPQPDTLEYLNHVADRLSSYPSAKAALEAERCMSRRAEKIASRTKTASSTK